MPDWFREWCTSHYTVEWQVGEKDLPLHFVRWSKVAIVVITSRGMLWILDSSYTALKV